MNCVLLPRDRGVIKLGVIENNRGALTNIQANMISNITMFHKHCEGNRFLACCICRKHYDSENFAAMTLLRIKIRKIECEAKKDVLLYSII